MIDPVLARIGPLTLHWYGALYSIALLLSGTLLYKPMKRALSLSQDAYMSLLFNLMLGILVGGRLGYVILYDGAYYSQNWLSIFYLSQGGMSYHGGLVGSAVAVIHFCYRHKLRLFQVTDWSVFGACIGVCLGRIGNFINGELYGHVTTVPWGLVFPGAGPLPRHPSQLYEAISEGVLVGIVLLIARRYTSKRTQRPGLLTGIYCMAYSLARFVCEFFRVPDFSLSITELTLGQVLSLVMASTGAIIVWYPASILWYDSIRCRIFYYYKRMR